MTSPAQHDAPDQSAEEPAVNEHPNVGRDLQDQIAEILGGTPEDYAPR